MKFHSKRERSRVARSRSLLYIIIAFYGKRWGIKMLECNDFFMKKDCDCNQVSGGRVHPEGKLLKKEYVKASKSQFNDS